MTPNFAEQAEKYALKMGSLIRERTDGKPTTLDNLKAIAEVNAKCGFLAGCEHGYRVGHIEADTQWSEKVLILEAENINLKAQLAERDKMIAIMSDIGHKKHLENRRKFEELRTRIEDAESALGFIRVTIRRMGYDNKPPGPLGDFCQSIDAYFTKHPQDGANGGA